MTPGQLRQIAEACGYRVDHRCVVFDGDRYVATIGPHETPFEPHLDANQAEACLNRRFSKDGHPVWTCERYHDRCTVYGLLDSWVEGEPADTFALAAYNTILESLK